MEEKTVVLDSDEMLVFYTDGITEAMNPRRDEFGEEGLLETIKIRKNGNVTQLREQILKSLYEFMAGVPPHDDITMVLVKSVQ